MQFIRVYALHFFLLGIMGMAYSMPVPINQKDKQCTAAHDAVLGSPKTQSGNSNFSIRHRTPENIQKSHHSIIIHTRQNSNNSGSASNSNGSTSNNSGSASNNGQ